MLDLFLANYSFRTCTCLAKWPLASTPNLHPERQVTMVARLA